MASESKFQAKLIKEIGEIFEGVVILKNDPNYLQGFPDLLILYGPKWAVLECKDSKDAPHRPNQEYYVNLANQMGAFGSFIYPENKGEVLNGLQRALRRRR